MGIIPIIRASKLIPIFIRVIFKIARQVGSHVHLEHIINKTLKVTIPVHNKDLPKKTLLSILKQANISLEELLRLLGKR